MVVLPWLTLLLALPAPAPASPPKSSATFGPQATMPAKATKPREERT